MANNREALEAAFDEIEQEDVEPAEEGVSGVIGQEEAEPVAIGAEPITEDVDLAEEPALEEPALEEPAVAKAPASWTPAARETWGQLPAAAQSEIMKREKEVNRVLTTTGEARKHYDEFKNTVGPFEGLIRAEGGTPMQAVETLLGTAATLQTGTQQAKAGRIAELIQHYGVDIQTLDSMLAGQAPQGDQSSHQFEQMLDQRMAPINQFLSQQQQQQQNYQRTQQTEATTQWSTFRDSHDFAPDVSNEMADLIEVAARRGHEMSLNDAYQRAIALRPDIQQIVDQRKAATNANAQNSQMQGKRQAASSMASGGSMVTGTPSPNSRREALEQAFNE